MTSFGYFHTPIGTLYAQTENGYLTQLSYRNGTEEQPTDSSALLTTIGQALDNYFRGDPTALQALPLSPSGTDFEKRVWAALRTIPFGEVRTYGEIADLVGCPKGARAVGSACHRNPILLCIPCHRVVGANGNLTGFACGTDIKRRLLEAEAGFTDGKIKFHS